MEKPTNQKGNFQSPVCPVTFSPRTTADGFSRIEAAPHLEEDISPAGETQDARIQKEQPAAKSSRRLRPPPNSASGNADLTSQSVTAPLGTKISRYTRQGLTIYTTTYRNRCPRSSTQEVTSGMTYKIPGGSVGGEGSKRSRAVFTSEYVLTDEKRDNICQRRRKGSYAEQWGQPGNPYLVIGIFNRADRIPRERVMII